MPTLVVEFVGMHGAGKTTTCRKVATLLREQGYPAHEAKVASPIDCYAVRRGKGVVRCLYLLLRMSFLTGRLVFENPALATHYLSLAIRSRERVRRSRRPPWGYFSAFQFHALRRRERRNVTYSAGITIFQQSVYMDIPNATLLSPSAAADWVVRETPFEQESIIRLFVFLECSAAVLKGRLTSRKGHPRSRQLVAEPAQIERRCDTLAAVRITVERLARERAGLHVVAVRTDSEDSVDETAAKICEHITAIWCRLDARSPDPHGIHT